jgi:hypothetical protein
MKEEKSYHEIAEIRKGWLKPAIKEKMLGCLCCGGKGELLPMEAVMYNGFGGWTVTKNGETFYCGDHNSEWEEFKTIAQIEEMIGEDDESEYLAIKYTPLSGGTFQRQSKNHWVLIEENMGFA